MSSENIGGRKAVKSFEAQDKMKKEIPQNIKPILEEVKKILKKIYGEKLKGVILYGSYARGDATEESDIDLIVILKDMSDQVSELEKCSKEIHQLDFLYDTLISIIPFKEEEFRTRRSPIILNAKREGIEI